MPDLYACRLPLAETGPAGFERAVEVVRKEAPRAEGVEALIEGDTGSSVPAPGASVRWRLLTAPGTDDRVWTLWWHQADDEDPELSWTLSIRVALEGERTVVGLQVGLESLSMRLSPVRLEVEPPPLVGAVVDQLEIIEDGWRISQDPSYAVDRSSVQALVEFLLDPDRLLPVVVITAAENYGKGADSYGTEPLVDAGAVGRALVGLAHVVVLDHVSVSYHLTDLVGKHLSVFGGGVRLYWPGLTLEDRPSRHPLWVPDRLEEPANQPFEKVLLRRLAPAASARLNSTALESRLRLATERHRRAEIARLFDRAKDASLAPEWQEELERAWSDNARLQEEVADLAAQLEWPTRTCEPWPPTRWWT